MASLPQKLTLEQLMPRWASILNPFISKPALQVSLLKSQVLKAGNNTLSHGLGRQLQGWYPVRFYGAYSALYDLQSNNKMPELTLILNSSVDVTIDLVVF